MSQSKLIRNLFLNFQSKLQFFERRFIKKSCVRDVTPTELKTLYIIQLSDNKTMSGLADVLKVTQGTFTSTINSLEKKGYVKRKRSNLDKRIINLSLTKKSEKVIDSYEKFHNEIIDKLISDFDEDKRSLVEEILAKLNKILITS